MKNHDTVPVNETHILLNTQILSSTHSKRSAKKIKVYSCSKPSPGTVRFISMCVLITHLRSMCILKSHCLSEGVLKPCCLVATLRDVNCCHSQFQSNYALCVIYINITVPRGWRDIRTLARHSKKRTMNAGESITAAD